MPSAGSPGAGTPRRSGRTKIKLPDAYALATALNAEHDGHADVSLASFDSAVLRAHSKLRA
jgi:hypothetical protein